VWTGKVEIFHRQELTADHLMASACLPTVFQAVEIDGEPYWDGGYMGNPAIFPLIYGCDSHDVVIVQVNPINHPRVPKSAREILDRVTEISFNSSLMREMRAIAFVTRLIEEGSLANSRYRKLHMHMIESEAEMAELGASSKLDTDWQFLLELRDLGRAAATRWLAEHFDKLGHSSSIDLGARFL
jgi:NTE family protein